MKRIKRALVSVVMFAFFSPVFVYAIWQAISRELHLRAAERLHARGEAHLDAARESGRRVSRARRLLSGGGAS
ncbi:MAG: hypothetical protein LCH38_10930 [Proteobacteria bacterium]|nr:hypothetical protein [Pseudomonadota bacterium]